MEKVELRPSVQRFAEEMEMILRQHDKQKYGWSPQQCPLGYLKDSAVREAIEYWQGRSSKELVDIANFLMMIWHRETGTSLYS